MEAVEQENLQLREEVITLRAELEKKNALIASLMAVQNNHHLLLEQLFLPFQSQQRHQTPHQAQQQPQPKPIQQAPLQAQPQSQSQPRQLAPQQPNKQKLAPKKGPRFDSLPMLYADLLPILIEDNLVQTKALARVPTNLPSWHKRNVSCAFHQGAPGHDIEHCLVFKAEIQRLIDTNKLSFKDLSSIVQLNPLPEHETPSSDKNAKKDMASMPPLKNAQKVVQDASSAGCGRIVTLSRNKRKEELGISPSVRSVKSRLGTKQAEDTHCGTKLTHPPLLESKVITKPLEDVVKNAGFIYPTAPDVDVVVEEELEGAASFVARRMV